MEKNWLIRTQNQKILGPVSKSKILELVQKRSLSDDDEVCPGNGYWFFIREKELVEQFLYGDLPSSFNPVSEAPKNILGHDENWIDTFLKQMEGGKPAGRKAPMNSPAADVTLVKNLNDFKKDLAQADEIPDEDLIDNSAILPESSDLEYPDMDDLQVSSPHVATISVSSAQNKNASATDNDEGEDEVKLPENSDLEYPDMAGETLEAVPPPVEKPPKAPPMEEKKKAVPLPPKNSSKKPLVVKTLTPSTAAKEPVSKTGPDTDRQSVIDKPTVSTKVDTKPIATVAQNKDIDPMLILQLANSGKSSTSSAPKRNDHFLVIAFVVILGIIGFLFYQYKQMIKKTVTTKQQIVKEKSLPVKPTPQVTPEAIATASSTEPLATPEATLQEENPVPMAAPQE